MKKGGGGKVGGVELRSLKKELETPVSYALIKLFVESKTEKELIVTRTCCNAVEQ